MLLLNICVLVGAVLTPPSLRWMYSTHIAMLCLYQIHRKDWWGMIFVSISIVSLISSNPWKDWGVEDKADLYYWNVTKLCLLIPSSSEVNWVYVKSKSGEYRSRSCDENDTSDTLIPIKPYFAELFGSYPSHRAFIKGADVMVYIDHGINHLDEPSDLDQYPSWRFAYSIIRGDRRAWDERDHWLINYLGLTHLFVVSGLHIGFVSLLVVWVCRVIWRHLGVVQRLFYQRARLEFVAVVPFCLFYALWSGAGEPAIRACLMAVMFFALRAKAQHVALLPILLFSAWLMLLLWPGRALDPSFWLSFSFVGLISLLILRLERYSRLLIMQCFLCFFALMLTLGWQQSVSGLTILANIIMVPFVAIIWFPASLASYVLSEWFSWTWLYGQLDRCLVWLFGAIEPYLYGELFWLPREDTSVWVKLTLISLAVFAVYWYPLRRSVLVLGFLSITAVSLSVDEVQWRYLWQKDRYGVIQYRNHGGGVLSYNNKSLVKVGGVDVVINIPKSQIAHKAMKEKWQLAITNRGSVASGILYKMNVPTIEMLEGERIRFYLDSGKWRVISSTCYHLLNVVKTVACEHAELLESMLNYSQIDTGGLGVRAF
ncbi:MAG: ComEC/Rec2 family competence protein [Marinomonas atlantica]|nr:ComEC/Rec2 family competence protein [Marinomonas atlantica]